MIKRVRVVKGKTYEAYSIEIHGVQPGVAKELENIAENLGYTISELLRPELRKLRDSYPENMRQNPNAV